MRSKWLGLILPLMMCGTPAWAAVDANAADETALQQIKGIGVARAHAIVVERNAHGAFKNADDFAGRVKGVGPKSLGKLQAEGLTIGAKAPPAQPPAARGTR